MVNYANGKIYKLTCNETDDVYIGSTCEKLSVRKAKHHDKYKAFLRGTYRFTTSFKLYEISNCVVDIELVELFPCNSKDELHAREKYWIQNTQNTVNKNLPTNSYAEYYIQNKAKILNNVKLYRDANKDKIKEYFEANKERLRIHAARKYTCECGKTLLIKGKSEHELTKKHIKAMADKK
jgi:hypothetical protein